MPSSHDRRALRARRRQLALQHEWLVQLALTLVGGPDDPSGDRAELVQVRRPADIAPDHPTHRAGQLTIARLDGHDPVRAPYGRTVPPDVDAVGLVVPARAWCAIRCARHEHGTFVHLVTRAGTSVTVTPAGGGHPPQVIGPAAEPSGGRVPDACRRILGLPTAPPPPTCTDVVLDAWLETVLATTVRQPGVGWATLASASPVVTDLAQALGLRLRPVPTPAELAEAFRTIGELVPWEAVRAWVGAAIDEGGAPHHLLEGFDREALEWMDLGMFARQVADERLPVAPVLDTLAQLLAPLTFDRVTATIALTIGATHIAVA